VSESNFNLDRLSQGTNRPATCGLYCSLFYHTHRSSRSVTREKTAIKVEYDSRFVFRLLPHHYKTLSHDGTNSFAFLQG